MAKSSEFCPEGCLLKNGKRAVHGPSRCSKRKPKNIDQTLPKIPGFYTLMLILMLADVEILQKETHSMGIEGEHDERSSVKSLTIEISDRDERRVETPSMEDEEEEDSSIDREPLEYITDQTKRTKRFNTYKRRGINLLNHIGAKTGSYGILYLRKYQLFISS
jgi:hypothetical protein